MSATRLRFTMIGFIAGVIFVFLDAIPISQGTRFAMPFYLAGAGLLVDGIIVRLKG
ncbi:hypothetical protein [Brevibacillus dissolubilis]|uniref:hypothetical protein n=1 Tax=Brevibacillus dissolubilis TaxID=1844116 RepID=UPI00159B8993|nr:hypothetical protein [Brevibacillus dissolubilis]